MDFGYGEEILIEDMNIDVLPGQTVAIVGPTGAGKTTMINLLMRFYELNGGKITIDGLDTGKMSRTIFERILGWYFKILGSLMGRLKTISLMEKTEQQMKKFLQLLETAHADHFIRTLPDGYETVLNEEASNISQGQKQLLTIARAVLADPPIMILDEATSSVDTRTEVYYPTSDEPIDGRNELALLLPIVSQRLEMQI